MLFVKNFPKKDLTGYRFSSPIPGMVAKNLNKKVGCALIAASLLAASGVQGSNAQNAGRDNAGTVPLHSSL
jgi:hypothetical protein